jgi:hypothetical protein
MVPPHVSKRTHKILLWASFFLIIFGVRMFICNQFAVDAPFSDDWQIIGDLNNYRDTPILGPLLFKIHSAHIISFTRIEQLINVKFNGLWEMRVQNVLHSFIYSIYSLVTTLLINRVVKSRDLAVFAIALGIFAIPWAGDLTLWSLLSSFTWMMLFSVIQTAVLSLVGNRYLKAFLSLVVCSLASISMGAGSLTAILAAGWFTWLAIRNFSGPRSFNISAAAVHIGLFFFYYSLIPGSGEGLASDPVTSLKAFFRCLAFPTINVWPIGLLSFAPWFFLAWSCLRSKEVPSKEKLLLLFLGALVVMQSLGIAVFRGDNNNGGIPASRYYEILILGPLVNAAIILACPDLMGRKVATRTLATFLWTMMTLSGFLLMFFWRVCPWFTMDSGEWEQGLKQASLASWTRYEIETLPDYVDKKAPEISFHEDPEVNIRKFISRENDQDSLLPGAMFGGYPLSPAMGQDGFNINGYPDNRRPKPWLRYWGSHDRTGSPDKARKFESQPFASSSRYLDFDILTDKKSRFRFYNLGNSSLKLVRISDGYEIDLLKQLAFSFPSILRDRESVCVRLPAAGTYKIVAEDHEVDSGWFAFSEPTASGPLAYLTEPVLNSGKLITFAGIIALATSLFIRRSSAIPADQA